MTMAVAPMNVEVFKGLHNPKGNERKGKKHTNAPLKNECNIPRTPIVHEM